MKQKFIANLQIAFKGKKGFCEK